ncbi:MAG TPA: inorganic diphosphatase [Bacilli bacterium]|nr:inorganic diphosphatase [Bacilli bacterium]
MNVWHDVNPARISKDEFLVCVEISKGSKMKYELDKETGRLILDRVLYTSTHYPNNYGFIPRTLSGDGDALDVLIMCTEPIVPLALVKAYPIGILKMIDSDEVDEKIIAITADDPSLNRYTDISELPPHMLEEITHFFTVYKELEGKKTFVKEIAGSEEAKKIIAESMELYDQVYLKKEKK